jgi:hypothetical protein
MTLTMFCSNVNYTKFGPRTAQDIGVAQQNGWIYVNGDGIGFVPSLQVRASCYIFSNCQLQSKSVSRRDVCPDPQLYDIFVHGNLEDLESVAPFVQCQSIFQAYISRKSLF